MTGLILIGLVKLLIQMGGGELLKWARKAVKNWCRYARKFNWARSIGRNMPFGVWAWETFGWGRNFL